MSFPRIYADFQNLDDENRLRLTCVGTVEDLARHHIQLREGLFLTFYMDDADDDGKPNEMLIEGSVLFNQQAGCWVAIVDWSALRHASDEEQAAAPAAAGSQLPVDGPIARTN